VIQTLKYAYDGRSEARIVKVLLDRKGKIWHIADRGDGTPKENKVEQYNPDDKSG